MCHCYATCTPSHSSPPRYSLLHTPRHAAPRHTAFPTNHTKAPADAVNLVLALVTAGYALNLYWAKEIMQKVVGRSKGKKTTTETPTLPLGEKAE